MGTGHSEWTTAGLAMAGSALALTLPAAIILWSEPDMEVD